MTNHYTRSSKKAVLTKDEGNSGAKAVVKKAAAKSKATPSVKPSSGSLEIDIIKETGDKKSPSSVIPLVDAPILETPVKRKLQADITGEVQHEDKKKCSGTNDVEKHYVFSLARGGFDVVSGDENAALFRTEWGPYIMDTKVFDTKTQADTFAKTLAPSPPSTPIASITNVDEEEQTPLSASSDNTKIFSSKNKRQ